MTKVALVTGTSSGSLGEAVAEALRQAKFRVLTTTTTCPVGPDSHPLELTSRESVHAASEWVTRTADRLDVLVNNAGIHLDLRSAWTEPREVDGHEVHWRTNYLGTAHLTRLLIPRLLSTAEGVGEARVVNVVSALHARGRNEALWGDLDPYDSWAAYGTSKLALIHEATEIERRFGQHGLHGYAVHPGSLSTNVADRGLETAPVLRTLRTALLPVERRVLSSPAVGARAVMVCATSPDAVPGGYHRGTGVAKASADAEDGETAMRLWERTSSWVVAV
jgi:NAD(P)-dependent dehydrogenase (short-subunit alcohol dehydrogenase family)